jgi:hypothetical protein
VGVGELPAGSEFSEDNGRGRKSAEGIDRKRGRFGLWYSRKLQNRFLPWAGGAPNAECPTGQCLTKQLTSRQVRCMLPPGLESIKEMPDYSGVGQARAFIWYSRTIRFVQHLCYKECG